MENYRSIRKTQRNCTHVIDMFEGRKVARVNITYTRIDIRCLKCFALFSHTSARQYLERLHGRLSGKEIWDELKIKKEKLLKK